MLPNVAVVIVNWNGKADTLECLSSLKQADYSNTQVIVVDNGSMDDSVSAIQSAFPETILLQTGKNLGFCGGNNKGIRKALETGCDYVFLVNNDTIMEANCLQHLIKCAQNNPHVAVVCPAMYHYNDRKRAWFTGSVIDMEIGFCENSPADISHLDTEVPLELPWATGCAMLIPCEVIRQLNGFDERFFCYYEDVDLSFRAKALGYKILLCPGAKLYHKVSSSSGHDSPIFNYYMTRNGMLFFTKHTRGKQRLHVLLRMTRRVSHQTLPYIKGIKKNPKAYAIFCGAIDFYFRRFHQNRHSL